MLKALKTSKNLSSRIHSLPYSSLEYICYAELHSVWAFTFSMLNVGKTFTFECESNVSIMLYQAWFCLRHEACCLRCPASAFMHATVST